MEKQKYVVHLQSQQISLAEEGQNQNGITIYATPTEVENLRKTFDSLQAADFVAFFRAHVPIMPYHKAKSVEQYDNSLVGAVHMLYDLGDDDAKHFIEESGAIGERPINTNDSYPNNHSHSDK